METQGSNFGLTIFQTQPLGKQWTFMLAVRTVTQENTCRSWSAIRCTSVQGMEALGRNFGRTMHQMTQRGWLLIFIRTAILTLVNSWPMWLETRSISQLMMEISEKNSGHTTPPTIPHGW